MFTEPRRLINETIDKLETRSAYFSDEIEELQTISIGELSVETLAAREALQTIQILIPKLSTDADS